MESYFYFDRRLIEPKKKKRRYLLIIPLAVCASIILAVLMSFIFFPKPQAATISKEIKPTPTQAQVQIAQSTAPIEAAVLSALTGATGKYAVYIKDLKGGGTYQVLSHDQFETASLYKLWIMAETFSQLEDGTLKAEQGISQDAAVLNKKFGIASESAELKEGRVSRTISDALFRMITYSDNYSALLLSEKVRLANVADFLKENGFEESSVGTKATGGVPKSTAFDIGLFYEKLYKGELANSEDTTEMIDLLKGQTINGKLPRNLPEDVIIAHKTGELGRFSHDAGIVYTPAGDYIIVVLSESNSKEGADTRIADISKNVYDTIVSRKQ